MYDFTSSFLRYYFLSKESIEDYHLRIKNHGFGNEEINSSNDNSYKFNSLVLGIMSLNTKGRIQGVFGLILGLAELLLIIFLLVIFSSVFGWRAWG